MSTQVNVYIGFNGDCRKAMEFYKDCLGGELDFQIVGDSPIAGQCPEGMKNSVLHSTLTRESMIIMATDMVGPDGYIKGNNVSLCMNCSSEEEINDAYGKLTAGGKILDSLKRAFWGDFFACFTDKFGITWLLNYHPVPTEEA